MGHRITLLKILEIILNENIHAVKAELGTTIVGFMANEMTLDQVIPFFSFHNDYFEDDDSILGYTHGLAIHSLQNFDISLYSICRVFI